MAAAEPGKKVGEITIYARNLKFAKVLNMQIVREDDADRGAQDVGAKEVRGAALHLPPVLLFVARCLPALRRRACSTGPRCA